MMSRGIERRHIVADDRNLGRAIPNAPVAGMPVCDDNLAGFLANLAGSWRGQSAPLAATWRPALLRSERPCSVPILC